MTLREALFPALARRAELASKHDRTEAEDAELAWLTQVLVGVVPTANVLAMVEDDRETVPEIPSAKDDDSED